MSQPFTIELANRPGELARLARALAVRGVDIRHIAGGAAGHAAWAFLTTDNDAATREVLRSLGYRYLEGRTITVEVEERPGALADLSERLGRAGVNIEGFMIVGHHGSQVEIAFSVDDEGKARAALGA